MKLFRVYRIVAFVCSPNGLSLRQPQSVVFRFLACLFETGFANRKALLTLIVAFSAFSPNILLAEKQVIGEVENVEINSPGFIVRAKIDTGAKNSSLHTQDYVLLERDSGQWVRFRVTNKKDKTIVLEKRVVRFVKIKRKGADLQRRPVIELDICIGNTKKRVQVNLVDRGNFNYPMLIGRTFLNDHFLVDVDKKFTRSPSCEY